MAWIIIGLVLIALIVGYGLYQRRNLSKQYQQSQQKKPVTVFDLEPEIGAQQVETTYQQRKTRLKLVMLWAIAAVVVVCSGGFAISIHWNKMVEKRAAEQVQKIMAEKQAAEQVQKTMTEKQADQQLPAKPSKISVKWASENDDDVWYSEAAAMFRFKMYLDENKVYKEQRLAQIKLERQELLVQKDTLRAEWLQIRTKGDATIQEINQKLYQKNMDDLDRQLADLESKAQSLKEDQMSFETWQGFRWVINAIFAAVLLCLWAFWLAYVTEDEDAASKLFYYGGGILLLGLLAIDLLFYRFLPIGNAVVLAFMSIAVLLIALLVSALLNDFGGYLRGCYLNQLDDNENLLVIARQPATIIAFIFTVLIIWRMIEFCY